MPAQWTNVVQDSLATLEVQVPIEARIGGNPNYNPTADLVYMAFMPPGTKPGALDWKTGTWATDPGPEYLAQCLVGPGGAVVLAVGVYTIWVKVVDNPETFVPAGGVGTLTIE